MGVGIRDSRSATVRQPAGFTIEDYGGKPIEHDTLKCVHCQFTWQHKRVKGINAVNWCKRCGGPVCSDPACRVCQHWEKKFEQRAKQRLSGPMFGHTRQVRKERRSPGGIILP